MHNRIFAVILTLFYNGKTTPNSKFKELKPAFEFCKPAFELCLKLGRKSKITCFVFKETPNPKTSENAKPSDNRSVSVFVIIGPMLAIK